MTLLSMLWLLAAACGSDEPTEGEEACTDLKARLTECGLTTNAVCNAGQPCAVRCAAQAECAQLTQPAPTGSYLQCTAMCSGAGPDDFICADGRQFVNRAGVCDGQFQCLDGSDEASCGAAGANTGG